MSASDTNRPAGGSPASVPLPSGVAAGTRVPVVSVTPNVEKARMLDVEPGSEDPSRHYRWVRKDDAAQTAARMKGYEIVRPGDSLAPNPVGLTQETDGTISVGDVQLMSCPKEVYNARRATVQAINDSRLQEAEEQLQALAKERGVKLIRDKE